MNVPLILDTNAISDAQFLNKIQKYHGRKILPAVAYAEVCVYFIGKKNKEQRYIDRLLRRIDIKVEPLDHHKAANAALCAIEGKDFKENARDYLIGAHAYPAPRTMVTYNKKDFWFLGDQVYSPDEILKKIEKNRY